jgi:hypothetical protein
VCPADLTGKTGAVQVLPLNPDSPDARAAVRPATADGSAARINSDNAITHTIIVIIPAARLEVSLTYGTDLATIQKIQSSIHIRHSSGQAGSAAPADSPAAPAVTAGHVQGLYQGPGFDTCAAPSAATMRGWLRSRYRAIGIYIGGVNRGCAQSNLTSSWLAAIQAQGWHYWPLYVGLQADCVEALGDATIVASKAAAEGRAAAADAVQQARNLGIPAGTPIVDDMEAYSGCGQQVVTFLSAWDSELHADGYQAGVYESFSNIGDLVRAAGKMTEPDVINYADWDGAATTASSYMPAGMWTNHQRLHQYLGGHDQTYGGATLNIDADQLNVNLGGASTPAPPGSPVPPLPLRIARRVVRQGRERIGAARLPAPDRQHRLVGHQDGRRLAARSGEQSGGDLRRRRRADAGRGQPQRDGRACLAAGRGAERLGVGRRDRHRLPRQGQRRSCRGPRARRRGRRLRHHVRRHRPDCQADCGERQHQLDAVDRDRGRLREFAGPVQHRRRGAGRCLREPQRHAVSDRGIRRHLVRLAAGRDQHRAGRRTRGRDDCSRAD